MFLRLISLRFGGAIPSRSIGAGLDGPNGSSTEQNTVCPGSSDPPEKIFNIFASENEGYIIC